MDEDYPIKYEKSVGCQPCEWKLIFQKIPFQNLRDLFSFLGLKIGSHPIYREDCEQFAPQVWFAYKNGGFSPPITQVGCKLILKMCFLEEDSSHFSQEKIPCGSLNTSLQRHHQSDQNNV